MSTTRLTFLYPHLFRSIRSGSEPISQTARSRSRAAASSQRKRHFGTAGRRREAFVQRHGKAVEPFLKQGETEEDVKVFLPMKDLEPKKTEEEKAAKTESQKANKEVKPEDAEKEPSSAAPLSEETQAASRIPGDPDAQPVKIGSLADKKDKKDKKELTPRQQAAENTKDPVAPLEAVLRAPPPDSEEAKNILARPPHLQTPPYVHHFDTYALVQQVQAGGFTKEQSITTMKAVRELLAINLDVAKEGLISKSDVENETYLFRAACSELKTEIQNNRKASEEKMRRERTLLQHEVDILNQKLTQELLTLKDDLKGMFDDRKMTVRMEQRSMESAIQELNYKITVMLNSDSKSEIEGLRWVLTRRSVMGILFMAVMVLTSLRYASYKSHENDVKRKEEAENAHKRLHDHADASGQAVAEILAAN